MKKELNNYAFIDSQNLNLGIQKLGWKLDYRKFRVYLAEKYGVKKAYIFIGNEQDARTREKYLKSGPGKHYLKNRLKRFLSLTG